MSKWSQLVESLFRLYGANKVGKDKIVEMHNKKTITKEEMSYILSARTQ